MKGRRVRAPLHGGVGVAQAMAVATAMTQALAAVSSSSDTTESVRHPYSPLRG
jgi:hypothetical protein